MQNVLKVWYISLLSKYVNLISRGVLLCAFVCSSRGCLKVRSYNSKHRVHPTYVMSLVFQNSALKWRKEYGPQVHKYGVLLITTMRSCAQEHE
jgi:hypothetical protein